MTSVNGNIKVCWSTSMPTVEIPATMTSEMREAIMQALMGAVNNPNMPTEQVVYEAIVALARTDAPELEEYEWDYDDEIDPAASSMTASSTAGMVNLRLPNEPRKSISSVIITAFGPEWRK